ncbi:alcohol dehydrogenase GroES domain protein [Agrocybe pediades]|nr:alcohol dehydrogenase GroES domain protein [Agrocybe pediades]
MVLPEPHPTAGQLKVKIPKYASADKEDEVTGEKAPVTLGHEFSGTVVGLGEGVDQDRWKVGQNVVIEPVISCLKNTCVFCKAGTRNLCPVANFIGIAGWGGGLAEYIAGVSLEVGAMIEPLAVAYYSVKRSGFKKGQNALVIGGGPIGLFILKVLRSIDPSALIIVSEPASGRRSLASKHGATLVLDPLEPGADGKPSPTTVPSAVYQATNGVGIDVAFEAAGIQAGLDAALFSLRPRGTLVNVAVWEKDPVGISMNLVTAREINIIGILGYTGIHPELIEAVASGKINDLEELITRKIPIEDVVEKGIMALLNDKDSQVKILVHP